MTPTSSKALLLTDFRPVIYWSIFWRAGERYTAAFSAVPNAGYALLGHKMVLSARVQAAALLALEGGSGLCYGWTKTL
jgi:hypothetical protein